MKTLLPAFTALLCLASTAFAWDKPCHSVTGVIAYRDLQANHPDVVAKVTALLKQSADYDALLKWHDAVTGAKVPADEMLFQLSARWPDDIKSDGSGRATKPVNTSPYHYINLPTGTAAAGHPAGTPNIETAMQAFQTEWPTANNERKAELLSWFIHLIGDAHQPLHAADFYNSTMFKSGDAGGNDWSIKSIAEGNELHAFWDNVVIEVSNSSPAPIASEIEAKAISLATAHPRSAYPQMSTDRDFNSWIEKETFPLAVKVAYQNDQLPLPKSGKPTVLSSGYISQATKTAESQVALAGYRIADFLVVLFDSGSSTSK